MTTVCVFLTTLEFRIPANLGATNWSREIEAPFPANFKRIILKKIKFPANSNSENIKLVTVALELKKSKKKNEKSKKILYDSFQLLDFKHDILNELIIFA